MKNLDLSWLLEWTFKERENSLKAHKVHRYPATFVPELAAKIIATFSNKNDTVLDIFSGSGTTLLEASRLKRHSIGIELNPLAILIAKVKTTPIHTDTLLKGIDEWKQLYLDKTFDGHNISNKDFWFNEVTNKSLSDAIGAINSLDNMDIKDFLKICLSEIIREISYCVHSGFKLHRDKNKIEKKLSFNKNELLEKIKPVIDRNVKSINELDLFDIKNYQPKFYHQDSRTKVKSIINNSIDLILTSPPYGDSRTTVAYGQFSSFSSELLELKNISSREIRNLDNDLLGGETKNLDFDFILSKSVTIRNIHELFRLRSTLAENKKAKKRIDDRLRDVLSFYTDLDKCIENASNYLKLNGFFVLVTASRIVHETKLHTDNIIAELAHSYGFKLKNIYYRDIPNKRMPHKVSATNVVGEKTSTMTEESIIVLQKTR